MKKPEKQTPLCPLIKSECVEAGCKLWLEMERRNLVSGVRETYHECAFIVQVAVIGENSMALNKVDANIQELKTVVSNTPPLAIFGSVSSPKKALES
jgi:hypothetical protein